MEKKNRKTREREARTEHIVDVAEGLISEKGIENTTMDEIAERAGLGKGTLYLHFKGKTALFLAICQRGSAKLNRLLGRILAQDLPGIVLIEKLGKTYIGFIKNNPVYFTAFSYYESLIDGQNIVEGDIAERCEENAQEAMNYIVRALQVGMHDGSIKSDVDPRELGLIIWGASKGIMNMAYLKKSRQREKIMEGVEFSAESLFGHFIDLIGTGMMHPDYQSKNELKQ